MEVLHFIKVYLKILPVFVLLSLTEGMSAVSLCHTDDSGKPFCNKTNSICVISNTSNNYICECKPGYRYDEKQANCIEDFCNPESIGHRFCQSEKAICLNDPTNSGGFICICEEGRHKVQDICQENNENPETENPEINNNLIEKSTVSVITDVHSTSVPYKPTNSDKDPCMNNNCVKNTTCIAFNSTYMCECKYGFEPTEEYLILEKNCLDFCKIIGCKNDCDTIKQEKKCHKKVNNEAEKEGNSSGINGWIISTGILSLCLIVAILAIIYLIHRKNRLENSMQDNTSQKLMYKKIENSAASLSDDMVRNSEGTLVISYVIPNNKIKFKHGTKC